MHSRLIEILDEKKREVGQLKQKGLPAASQVERLDIRDFKRALSSPDRTDLIAEIKFASPSAGVIRKKSDPLGIGRMYDEAGAAAISLLTDEKFFGGNLNNLLPLKKAVSLPVLRKDFIIDAIQIKESLHVRGGCHPADCAYSVKTAVERASFSGRRIGTGCSYGNP